MQIPSPCRSCREVQGTVLTPGWDPHSSPAPGAVVTHRSRAHSAVLGRAGLAGICSPGTPQELELPSHSPEPAALGTQGQVKGTKCHPGSCPALGSVLCSSKHPHGQTSPVSIQDCIFPGWRERQMSVCLGLAGWLFVFEIPNWAELSSAWAQLREGCWGSPRAPCQLPMPSLH